LLPSLPRNRWARNEAAVAAVVVVESTQTLSWQSEVSAEIILALTLTLTTSNCVKLETS